MQNLGKTAGHYYGKFELAGFAADIFLSKGFSHEIFLCHQVVIKIYKCAKNIYIPEH